MFKSFLLIVLSVSAFSIANENDVGLIITNYYYDQWGRPIPYTQVRRTNYYYNPYRSSYYNPYTPFYYSQDLPGADPDRFEEMYYQNLKR